MIVPYCSACLDHATRPQTLRLGVLYGSVLLGVSGAILLAANYNGWFWPTFAAVVLAGLPALWTRWWNLPRQLGHAARGNALLTLPQGLLCASEGYARELAEQCGSTLTRAPIAWSHWRVRYLIGPMLALFLSPCLHHLFFPLVRVVNFTDRTIVFSVDGRGLATIEPTSGENPAVGKVVRAPSGTHRLEARWLDGGVASSARAQIRSGYEHLYAPGALPDCFYLQRVSYGRSRFLGSRVQPLYSDSQFWVVPHEVDSWFTPEKPLDSGATTGGVVTLLRMGRCR